MKKGATPSDRVHRFLADAGVVQPLKKHSPQKMQAQEEGAGTRCRQREGRPLLPRRSCCGCGRRRASCRRSVRATFFSASSSARRV